MTRTSTGRTIALLFSFAGAALISGCSNVRLQSSEQAVAALTNSAQAQARHSCEQNRDSRDYFDCVKRVNKSYDVFREERTLAERRGG